MAERAVLVDWPSDGVLRIQLNRPDRHNAVDADLLEELSRAMELPGARAVVLCSSTRGRFCGGADLAMADATRARVSDRLYALYASMSASAVPIVAALDGPAVGAGAQLAVASDLRVASEATWLRFVGPGHGLAVGAWALPSLVGRGRALDLCLTSRRIDAKEAFDIGLVDRVVADPHAESLEIAKTVAALDTQAVANVKEIVRRSWRPIDMLDVESTANHHWNGAVGPSLP